MQATADELDALLEVQQMDLDVIRLTKEFEELPQRTMILEARKNAEALEGKLAKIEALGKETRKKIVRITDEDASLQKKENGVQAAIEAAGNDFRNAEARTKELDGIFKRRGELAANLEEAQAESKKISDLEAQVRSALEEVGNREAQATESFKQQGTEIQNAIAQEKARREHVLSRVSAPLASLYEKTAQRFTTVSLSHLEGSKCSVCRAKIDGGRLLDLKQEAPLSHCPSCKRLMIIREM